MTETIVKLWQKLIDTTGFLPRWHNQAWNAPYGWSSIGSDVTIGMACILLISVLSRFTKRRSGIATLLNVALIGGAGAFLLDAAMFWWPAYRLLTAVKVLTAIIAVLALLAVRSLMARIAALCDPIEFHREIAQRRRTELELRQVHVQLEGVIEQRTSELASKNQEMEQFLNTVSHDLKNPIVNCLGLIGMVRQDVKEGKREETLDSVARIERSITRMRQLIEDLLNLSRLGKVRFELSKVDTQEMFHSISEDLRLRFVEAGVVIEIENDLPCIHADERWLSEVFENLLTNALKYGCDNPSPRIVVGSVMQSGEARIFIRDNGRGIASAHHAQIFEPFRRFRSDKEGSGMGLAIVARIVNMHGGRVWIESEVGRGATFWVALPALPESVPEQCDEILITAAI